MSHAAVETVRRFERQRPIGKLLLPTAAFDQLRGSHPKTQPDHSEKSKTKKPPQQDHLSAPRWLNYSTIRSIIRRRWGPDSETETFDFRDGFVAARVSAS